MTTYIVYVSKSAEKSLVSIPKNERGKILSSIESLASNPFPSGCKKLSGEDSTFRIRIGNYRVIYELDGAKLIILVLKIGHRKDIYR